MSESISNAHDATVYERGRAHGINEERRAIVAWLREQLSAAEEWESANDWHSGASNAANTCETTMSDAHCCHCADCALNGNDDGIHSDAPHKWRKHRPEYTRRNHRGVKSYSTWVRDECPLCFAAEQERVAIVAWLREQQWTTRVLDIVAGAIERGEHLGADDE